jgi:hypothetical protein
MYLDIGETCKSVLHPFPERSRGEQIFYNVLLTESEYIINITFMNTTQDYSYNYKNTAASILKYITENPVKTIIFFAGIILVLKKILQYLQNIPEKK